MRFNFQASSRLENFEVVSSRGNYRKPVYDPKEWMIVSKPAAYLQNSFPTPSNALHGMHIRFAEVTAPPEHDMTVFQTLPLVPAQMIWEYTLPGPRFIRLREEPFYFPFPGPQNIPPVEVLFYRGKRFEVEENMGAFKFLGTNVMRNKYVWFDTYISSPARSILPPSKGILIDSTKDTIVIEITDSEPPPYLFHLNLSDIKHLAIEIQTSQVLNPITLVTPLALKQRATLVWLIASMFPNLKTLTVILGTTPELWTVDRPGSEFRLVEVNDKFLEMEATYNAAPAFTAGYHLPYNTVENAMIIREWTRIAQYYRESFFEQTMNDDRFQILREREVKLEISMVAWFHGSRTQPRETVTVNLQPVKPKYYDVAFYTKLPRGPIDIEKTVGDKSKHYLSFEAGFRAKANPDGSLKTNIEFLEDITRLGF